MVKTIQHKQTKEITILPERTYEVPNAYIVPLACYYKEYYEEVNEKGKIECREQIENEI